MIRHKKNAHMANDFSCEDCDVSFGSSECFSRHDNSVHGEDVFQGEGCSPFAVTVVSVFGCF